MKGHIRAYCFKLKNKQSENDKGKSVEASIIEDKFDSGLLLVTVDANCRTKDE